MSQPDMLVEQRDDDLRLSMSVVGAFEAGEAPTRKREHARLVQSLGPLWPVTLLYHELQLPPVRHGLVRKDKAGDGLHHSTVLEEHRRRGNDSIAETLLSMWLETRQ